MAKGEAISENTQCVRISNIQLSSTPGTGVIDGNNSTLAFAPVPVPWETDSLPVIGSTVLFGLGLWGKRKLAQKQINQEEKS